MAYYNGAKILGVQASFVNDAYKMKFIRKITTTEAVSTVTISTDTDGAAFACDKIFLIVQFPSAIKLGTGGQTLYIAEATSGNKYLYYASAAHTTLILRLTAEAVGADSSNPMGITQIAFSQYDWSEDPVNYGRTQSGLTGYKKIVAGFEGGYTFPVGTVLTLYGRNA